jgi:CRISPR-associated protein Csy3
MKKIPSLLAITGSIDPSHAQFHSSKNEGEKKKLLIQKRSLVGTLGSFSEIEKINKAEKDGNVINPYSNIQTVDGCFLPLEHHNLHVSGTVKFSNMIDSISSNDPDTIQSLKAFYASEKGQEAIDEIAKRTVVQFLKAAPLHRNARAKSIELSVGYLESSFVIKVDHATTFDSDLSLEAQGLADTIAKALLGDINDIFVMRYEYIADVGLGQEVYPSEEFSGSAGKTLFRLKDEEAGMHTQKIGNGLRTIDTWYAENAVQPIPVDPFGPDKKNGCLRRTKKSVFKHIEALIRNKELNYDETCYLMASIIRGGVYSGKSEDKS